MNLQNQKWLNALALGSLSLLLLISAILLTPRVQDDSHALTCGAAECEEGYSTGLARTDLNARVASVVSLSAAPSLDFDLTPKAAGEFAESRMKVKVSTNNTSGFSLYLKAMGESNSLVSTDKTNTTTISPVASNTASESFSPNTWGYKLATAEAYDPVPVVATAPILNETKINPATGNEYDLAFGVKVDTNLPAGEYTGGIVISAVANPITVTSLYQLTYMQDMTSDICANTTDYVDKEHYATKQLIDTRDGNKYWVAKLADGNCWMVQNLALNLGERPANAPTEASPYVRTLTPDNSDVSEEWRPASSTNEVIFNNTPFTNEQIQSGLSWNFASHIVKVKPLASELCSDQSGDGLNVATPSYMVNDCREAGLLQVDSSWQPTYTAQDGSYTTPSGNSQKSFIAVNQIEKTYDAHYLIGNYYQYRAVAANGYTDGSSAVTASICPKGWTLPSNAIEMTAKSDYTDLLRSYGISDSTAGNVAGTNYNVASDPMYFVRAGSVVSSGVVRVAGAQAYYWSSTLNPSDSARVAVFNFAAGNLTQQWYHIAHASSVRCIAR